MNDANDQLSMNGLIWTGTAATIGAVGMSIFGYYMNTTITPIAFSAGLIAAIIVGAIIGIVFGILYKDKIFGYSVGAISGAIIIMGMFLGSIGVGILMAIGIAIIMWIGKYLPENWGIGP